MNMQEYTRSLSCFLAEKNIFIDFSKINLEEQINFLNKKIEKQKKELEYSKERIYKAFYHSHIAQIVTGTFGKIKSANQAFADLLGYKPKELVGIYTYDLVPENLKKQERIAKYLKGISKLGKRFANTTFENSKKVAHNQNSDLKLAYENAEQYGENWNDNLKQGKGFVY